MIEVYARFVEASLGEKSQDDYYRAAEGRLLGSGELAEVIRHRVGEHPASRQLADRTSVEDYASLTFDPRHRHMPAPRGER